MGHMSSGHSSLSSSDHGPRWRAIGTSYLEKQGFGWLFDTDDADIEDRRPLLYAVTF